MCFLLSCDEAREPLKKHALPSEQGRRGKCIASPRRIRGAETAEADVPVSFYLEEAPAAVPLPAVVTLVSTPFSKRSFLRNCWGPKS